MCILNEQFSRINLLTSVKKLLETESLPTYAYYFKVLFNSYIGPCQVLPFRTRVNLGAMANEGVLNIRLFSVLSRTLIGGSYPSAEVQSVYSTAPADCVRVAKASITIGITVTFILHIFFHSPARSRYLSFFSFLSLLFSGQLEQQSLQLGSSLSFVDFYKVWSSGRD